MSSIVTPSTAVEMIDRLSALESPEPLNFGFVTTLTGDPKEMAIHVMNLKTKTDFGPKDWMDHNFAIAHIFCHRYMGEEEATREAKSIVRMVFIDPEGRTIYSQAGGVLDSLKDLLQIWPQPWESDPPVCYLTEIRTAKNRDLQKLCMDADPTKRPFVGQSSEG